MYLEHFGLDQAPFRITPHTGIFFEGGQRGATLQALEFAVVNEEGIVKLSGEVGTGKTLLCRMLLSRLPETVDSIYLANPSLGPDDLLRLVAEELSIGGASDNPGVRLLEIQKELIARFAAGRRVVALVDEAHAMPPAALEQIRLLSNLETDNQKLLQIVLFGQPELDEILARQSMRQLRDRVTQHFRLAPLTRSDVASYLDFRLRAAGYRGPSLFSASAVTLLWKASSGLSRRINVLADKALLSAFSTGAHQVGRASVVEAIRDCEYPVPRAGWLLPAAGMLAAAIALVVALPERLSPGSEADEARASSATGPTVTGPALASPATPAAAPTAQAVAVALPPKVTRAPAADPPAPDARPDEAAGPARAPKVAVTTALDPPPRPQPAAQAAPVAKVEGVSAQAQQPEATAPGGGEDRDPAAPAVPAAGTPRLPIALGPVAAALQAGTPGWVARTAEDRWFIQLRTVDGARADDIDSFIARLPEQVSRDELRIYVRDLGWGPRVGVIFGEFETRGDAIRALAALPGPLRGAGAYPRQVKGLK